MGEYVATRLGDAVVDRLVEPLLGGVYAGQARSLSLRACLPQVYAAVTAGASLTEAAATAAQSSSASSAGSSAPVFAGLRGGVGRLAESLSEILRSRGVSILSGTIAGELVRDVAGWSVVTGARAAPRRLAADAVVLAVPAAATARLVEPHAAAAASALREIEYASMAIVTLAVEARGAALPGSGFLVPAVDGRAIKASTFSSTKWGWTAQAAQDLLFLRASIGRWGETSELQRPDTERVAIAVAEVSEALGHQLPRVVDAHVQRWGGALPQYTVGHVDRVARIPHGSGSRAGPGAGRRGIRRGRNPGLHRQRARRGPGRDHPPARPSGGRGRMKP